MYKVKYTGWRAADGVVFDSWDQHPTPVMDKDGKPVMGDDGKPKTEAPQPASFPVGVGRMIPGFDQGFAGMKVGGIRRIFIPWQLAYGARAMPDRGADHPEFRPKPTWYSRLNWWTSPTCRCRRAIPACPELLEQARAIRHAAPPPGRLRPPDWRRAISSSDRAGYRRAIDSAAHSAPHSRQPRLSRSKRLSNARRTQAAPAGSSGVAASSWRV